MDDNSEDNSAAEDDLDLEDTAKDNQSLGLDQSLAVNWLLDAFGAVSIYVLHPTIPEITPPKHIYPDALPDHSDQFEFVYPIVDRGFLLLTSKAEDMFHITQSQCKLHYTIEKMVNLLVDRIRASGIDDSEAEIEVAVEAPEKIARKVLEVIVNLEDLNVVLTNFDPGEWGEYYLSVIKKVSEKGYGYPEKAPRDIYRKSHESMPQKKNI